MNLVYGPSGVGKTTWWMALAEALFKESKGKKKTRLYIGDGGLETVEASGLVEDGIVEAMSFTDWDYPVSVVQQITEGYWPTEPGTPNSKLLPPTAEDFSRIGMWVFEGLTVVGDYIMGSAEGGLAARAAKGEKIGQDSPIMLSDPQSVGGLKFGGSPPAHYNFAQRRIIDAIQRSKALPGYVQWTGHERAAEDKDNGNEKIIGPDAAGKAITAKLGMWFGHMTHLTTATKAVKQRDAVTGKEVTTFVQERRAYTRDHADPDGLVFAKYLANTRIPLVLDEKGIQVNTMPEYLSPPDPLKFFSIIREAKEAKRAQRLAAS